MSNDKFTHTRDTRYPVPDNVREPSFNGNRPYPVLFVVFMLIIVLISALGGVAIYRLVWEPSLCKTNPVVINSVGSN